MQRRAEQVDQTRQRIVEATVHLHGRVGPAATTIAAIAEQAGVTRLTVYRHFPDDEALFAACSAHWMSQQVLPDPDAWAAIADPAERLRAGLTDLYRFYRAGESMLAHVYRDMPTYPESIRQQLIRQDNHFRAVLLKPFDASGPRRRRLRAVVGHAASFSTWQSLCAEQGLSNREAVSAMVALVLSV
jgi:AcrR family transcriptional regulator